MYIYDIIYVYMHKHRYIYIDIYICICITNSVRDYIPRTWNICIYMYIIDIYISIYIYVYIKRIQFVIIFDEICEYSPAHSFQRHVRCLRQKLMCIYKHVYVHTYICIYVYVKRIQLLIVFYEILKYSPARSFQWHARCLCQKLMCTYIYIHVYVYVHVHKRISINAYIQLIEFVILKSIPRVLRVLSRALLLMTYVLPLSKTNAHIYVYVERIQFVILFNEIREYSPAHFF